MKRKTFSNAALKAVLLKDRYPDGAAAQLMENTTLSCSVLRDTATLHTDLPDNHWAFTNKEEPKPRYRLCDNREDVFDSATGETIGYFNTQTNAADYVAFLNDRLKS